MIKERGFPNQTLFQGDGKFCERDACSEDPCYPGVSCYDTDAEPFFRCGPCPEGYRGDGVRCLPSACQQRPPPCFQVKDFLYLLNINGARKGSDRLSAICYHDINQLVLGNPYSREGQSSHCDLGEVLHEICKNWTEI